MTRAQKLAAGVATALSIGALVGIVTAQDAETQAVEPIRIAKRELHDNARLTQVVDSARAGQSYIITRSGEDAALLGPAPAPEPPPTTTAPPPTGEGYPLLTSGGFAPGCNLGAWPQRYNEGTTTQVVTDATGCWYKITDTRSGGGTRGELGAPTLGVDAEYQREFALYIPANVNGLGFVAQQKQDETAGSCANGGWSYPVDEQRLLRRVRSDCDADYRDLDFGVPPKDRWIGLWEHCKISNSGGFCHARVDPDWTGPEPYGPVKSVTGDTSSGGNVKPRLGRYGTGTTGRYIGVRDYRQVTP